jgi:hypothetical protein
MKNLPSNIEWINRKYARLLIDQHHQDQLDMNRLQLQVNSTCSNVERQLSTKHTSFNLLDMNDEICCLKNDIERMNNDFIRKKKQLTDEYNERINELSENSEKTHRLHQDLEKSTCHNN